MTRRSDSNLAQYERNSRFGHLVHALARSGNGAKLPSVRLCLNASKAESRLVMATISLGLVFCMGKHRALSRNPAKRKLPKDAIIFRSLFIHLTESRASKSSVDDLRTSRSVVHSRAATILRSIETLLFRLDDLSCQIGKSSFFCPFFIRANNSARNFTHSIYERQLPVFFELNQL